MKDVLFLLVFAAVYTNGVFAQADTIKVSYVNVMDKSGSDSTNRSVGRAQIQLLKQGAIVVRLKTNERSIEKYRASGQRNLAEKLEKENHKRNWLIMDAFKKQFGFCKVYFIYANRTAEFLKGKKGLFLNNFLQEDSTIQPAEKFVLLAEYGTVMANMREDEYHYKGVYKTVESGQPITTSAFFASDLLLAQLKEPFPFYSVVYLDNYYKAILRWSDALEKYYTKVITGKNSFSPELLAEWHHQHHLQFMMPSHQFTIPTSTPMHIR